MSLSRSDTGEPLIVVIHDLWRGGKDVETIGPLPLSKVNRRVHGLIRRARNAYGADSIVVEHAEDHVRVLIADGDGAGRDREAQVVLCRHEPPKKRPRRPRVVAGPAAS